MAFKIEQIIQALEEVAPKNYQESYDNSGLLVGNSQKSIKKALLTLDCTEAVVEEAIQQKCELIIAHHPIIFSGLKSITGKNYVERTIIKAIENKIAIYAMHTNLDNMQQGVNDKIAEKLGLENTSILLPKTNLLKKLITYVPQNYAEKVREALHKVGAGAIGNYTECSFSTKGVGTFKANKHANPFVGNKNKLHFEDEVKLEVIYVNNIENQLINILNSFHPYEEVAYDILPLHNTLTEVGSGMIGKLKRPMNELDFLKHIKKNMNTKCVKHTALLNKKIETVAICGGAGSFLLPHAIRQNADIFITADFKYHEFFDAENKIVIADIGHYESEQYTPEIFSSILQKKFPTFATLISRVNTNPVQYY